MHTFKYGCAIALRSLRLLRETIDGFCADRIYFGRSLARGPAGAIVFFPCRPTLLACGLAGIVAFIVISILLPLLKISSLAG